MKPNNAINADTTRRVIESRRFDVDCDGEQYGFTALPALIG